MLKDGEKGTVLQVDGKTYALAPHLPCGIVTPKLLRGLADAAERYQVKTIKITGATRIGLFGVREEDVDQILNELGLAPGSLVGMCVRSVRCCIGSDWCRLAQRDAVAVGLELDRAYHGRDMVNKMKIAVSGCPICCAESWVRDVGLIGRTKGWEIVVGGNVGSRPRIAQPLLDGLSDDRALAAVAGVTEFYNGNARRGERMGKMIERTGLEPLRQALDSG